MSKTKIETINAVKAEVKTGFAQLYNLCASAAIPGEMQIEMMKHYLQLSQEVLNNVKSKIATLEIMV